jgi:hypothetical protein
MDEEADANDTWAQLEAVLNGEETFLTEQEREVIKRRYFTGAALEALPEGTGVVKNSYSFSDLKRKGHPENDEWHTCGKMFLNPLEAIQTILDTET